MAAASGGLGGRPPSGAIRADGANRFDEAADFCRAGPACRSETLPIRQHSDDARLSFTCEFCDIIVVFGRVPRVKTAAQVLADSMPCWRRVRAPYLSWTAHLIGNKKAIKPVLREVILAGEAWLSHYFCDRSLIVSFEDEELIDANIATAFVGIETPNKRRRCGKPRESNRPDPAKREERCSVRSTASQAGMEVWSGMIVGFRQRQFQRLRTATTDFTCRMRTL